MSQICNDDAVFIEYILENYAQFTGAELEEMTHNEDPWINTRKGLKPNQRCEKVIDSSLMKSYYEKKWSEINSSKEE